LCDPNFANSQRELTEWLREAIQERRFGGLWENGDPRYAWTRKHDIVFEARLINSGSGEYKGYPLSARDGIPDGI